jgi:carboxypeptidase D
MFLISTILISSLTMLQLYIAGESYAGQHIPYIAKAIQDRNEAVAANAGTKWPVKGLLIGNGWISPADQYPSYFKFIEREGLVKPGTALHNNMNALNEVCLSKLEAPGAKDKLDLGACEFVLQQFLDLTTENQQCYNMYDVRLKDTAKSCGMNWPPDLVNIEPYLQRADVVKALNINPAKKSGWTECSGLVHQAFTAKKSLPSVNLLPGLIESGINILLFSGDKDLICNHIGTETLIHNMKWKGGTGFETSPGVWAPRHDWSFEDEPAGIYQSARNLTYVLFYNSSHMVPFDNPRQSRDMLDRFMNVDIASIGGQPSDSRIDGEKLPQTAVGGQTNSTAHEKDEKEKLKQTEMHAYTKSGEAVLVIVIIGVLVWGFFIWRNRRTRARRGYRGVSDNDVLENSSILNRFQNKRSGRDVETGDFDESELDQLHSPGVERENYAVGETSDDDDDHHEASHPGTGEIRPSS